MDEDYAVDYSQGDVLFDEELHLLKESGVYNDERVRVVVLQSKYIWYMEEMVPNDSVFFAYLYFYQTDGYTAQVFEGMMDEIDELGGMDDFLYEILYNEKETFADRGSSVSL